MDCMERLARGLDSEFLTIRVSHSIATSHISLSTCPLHFLYVLPHGSETIFHSPFPMFYSPLSIFHFSLSPVHIPLHISFPTFTFHFALASIGMAKAAPGPGLRNFEHGNPESFIFDRFYKGLRRALGHVSTHRFTIVFA